MTVYSPKVEFGSVSMVTSSLGPNDPELGQTRQLGEEHYVFVYANTEIAVGKGCVVTATTGYSVNVSSTVNADFCMGVVKHTTIPAGSYGWLMTRGFAPIQASAAVAIQPGEQVVLGANGFFTNIILSAATTVPYSEVVGKCVQSAASASTVGAAYIRV